MPGRPRRAHGQSPPRLLTHLAQENPTVSPSQPSPKSNPCHAQENLKILRQYARLLTQACHKHATADLAAHVQPLSPTPTTYPRSLQWFEALARPYQGTDTQGQARVEQLLQLFAASSSTCGKSEAHGNPRALAYDLAKTLPHLDLSNGYRRALAYDLAKTLPHFDRDLTAYYLSLPEHDDDTAHREYHLCVAHSIMRLHDPPDLATLRQHLATWRNQGLLHVLSLAAMHMPDLADWFHPPLDDNGDEEAHSLVLTLEALRAQPRDYARTISDFIATQDPATPTAQAIATTLDRLAILMSVKSDADAEHDLAKALQGFPCLDALETHELWCTLQPALVRALPPSLLRLDPSCAKKRVKQAQGTW